MEKAAAQQNADMLADAHTLLSLIAEKLLVPVEPHQSFNDRLLDAATRAGREPWTRGTHLIDMERGRQITAEGYDDAHDDRYDDGELLKAASCYLRAGNFKPGEPMAEWPWDREWWKPSTPERNFVKAGALIAAEIDRRDRRDQKMPTFDCSHLTPPQVVPERVDGQTRYHTVGKDGQKTDITDEIVAIIERKLKGNT